MTETTLQELRLEGTYFEPKSSHGMACTLVVRGSSLSIEEIEEGPERSIEVEIDQVLGRRDMFFRCGRYFSTRNNLPTAFLQRFTSRTERAQGWMERVTWKQITALALIFLASLVLIRVVFFSLTDIAVAVFPEEWEQEIGKSSYESFRETAAEDSQLSLDLQQSLIAEAEAMARAAGMDPPPLLYFHHAPEVGINAMAFPGGPIVVTDQLVDAMERDEVLAVIAHEYAHVEGRHSLHQIVDLVGLALMSTLFLGAEDAVVETLATAGIAIWGLSNSREFERDADERAVEMLRQSGHDPASLGRAIANLHDHICEDQGKTSGHCDSHSETGWLSTHPGRKERVNYLEEYAR